MFFFSLMASSYFSGDHHILLFTTTLEGHVTEDDSVSNLNFHYDLIESESEGEKIEKQINLRFLVTQGFDTLI